MTADRPLADPTRARAGFELIPAIDLRGGKCVRLLHGDFAQETIFGDDPAAMARRWQQAGAARLHVVDLEGSRDGAPGNQAAIIAILRAVTIPVQVAGGIRDEAGALRLLSLGAARIVLGTAAVRDPALVERLVSQARDAVIVALDARDGVVRTDGWTADGGVSVIDLATRMEALGVIRFLYTDIGRDGDLSGPNLAAYQALQTRTTAAIIASGGVGSLPDLVALAQSGVEAVVVGRALYTGAIDLSAARDVLKGTAT